MDAAQLALLTSSLRVEHLQENMPPSVKSNDKQFASRDYAANTVEVGSTSFPPSLTSPIIFKGGPKVAYRDPAAVYVDGIFREY